MSFYVTLPSHSNRHEFPNNQANSFKIRLPQPLRLQGGGWQVGLSAISLPDTHVNLYELVQKDRFIMSTTWDQTYPKPGGKDGETVGRRDSAQTLINDIQHLDWVVDGVSFMKAAMTHLEQRRKETAIQGGRFTNDQGKHTYVKFRWEGDDLLIDNTNVCHCKTDTPALYIYTKLAVKMGWLRKISSGLILGPNLRQDFMGDQIPNMKQPIGNDWNDVDDDQHNPVFWTVRSFSPDHLRLSMSCGWRFTNLNVAFRSVVGDPSRSLHVYSDVAGSMMVGNRVTDLLREIHYKREGRGTMYFEPLHIQYLPLRNEVVEIIQIQVTETSGTEDKLVRFGKGNTLVTLHFKKTSKEKGKRGWSVKDAKDKSTSKTKKATRRSLASGRSRASLDGRGKSRGVGSGGWCGGLRWQKSHGSGHHSEEKERPMRRGIRRQRGLREA